jgi:hypothetical protein
MKWSVIRVKNVSGSRRDDNWQPVGNWLTNRERIRKKISYKKE